MKLLVLILGIVSGFRVSPIKMNVINPVDIINSIGDKTYNGNEWTNLDIYKNTIDSAAILQNQHAIFFSSDGIIHRYNYIDATINKVIEYLNVNKINYQVFDIQYNNFNIIEDGIQLLLLYILLNILYNIVKNNTNMIRSVNNKYDIVHLDEDTNFDNIAGITEAKEELLEIVDYLQSPDKYIAVGAKIPRGILLEGPPGTGKTLLARAVAGEAGVSFISATGSSFVEMFIGVGAARVRELFDTASKNKPCVIFIDEIDTIGGKRGSGFNGGGNDEREQTLNQLLTCMDGFKRDDGIIVLAATNRIDMLDSALKRSGRFDRKITINLPNYEERKQIFEVHSRDKNIGNVSIESISRLTNGFSGADLETLVNEASLLSIKYNKSLVDDNLLLEAYEKMVIGLPKKIDTRTNYTKELVAAHETGHAMIVKYFSQYFILHRVTINSNTRGAGGYTLFTPIEDVADYPTKGYFLAQLMVALGGRAAEIIYFKNKVSDTILDSYDNIYITSGASNDLKQANQIAREYLKLFEDYTQDDLSELTKNDIEIKTKKLIKESLDKAIFIIENNKLSFDSLIELLLEETTLIY